MREYVTPYDFGAVGDGQHDDTNAIRLAFEAATKENGLVKFPKGIYRTGPQQVPAEISIEGVATWSYWRNSRATLVPLDADQPYMLNVTNANATTIYGITLDGKDMGTNMHGLYMSHEDKKKENKDEQSLRIDTVKVTNFTGNGAHLSGAFAVSLRHSMFRFCGGYGTYLAGCDMFVVDCCYSTNNVGFGGDTWNSAVNLCECRIEWNKFCGVKLSGGMRYNLTGNYIDRSFGPGIIIEAASNHHKRLNKDHTVMPYAITVTGNTIVRSGRDAKPGSDGDCHILLRKACGVTITGNTFNIWKDDGRNGRISPWYGIILDSCADCVITANTFLPGAVKEIIHDKGGHGGNIIIRDNPGCSLPAKAWNIQDPFTPVHFLLDGDVPWYRDMLKGESNEE